MKKLLLVLLLAAPLTAWSSLITVNSFNDIQNWTGSGTNRAALVLEFGNAATPASVAWGYRWNGATNTAATMLFALAGTITGSGALPSLPDSDRRLSVDVTFFLSFSGYLVNRISYDQVGLPNPWSQVVRLIEDKYDPDIGEGPFPAFYSLNTAGGLWPNSSFSLVNGGISTTLLSNGMWVGFTEGMGINSYIFAQPAAAVPEPTTISLVFVGLLTAVAFRRRGLSRFAR